MLPLDDPRWETFACFGGEPHPALVAQLRALTEEPTQGTGSPFWEFAWDELHHQGDAFVASYAAVPYIVDAAARCAPESREVHLFFTGAVALDRYGLRDVPNDIRDDFVAAVRRARSLADESLGAPGLPAAAARYVVEAIANLHGIHGVEILLEELECSDLSHADADCPHCRAQLSIAVEQNRRFGVSVSDPAPRAARSWSGPGRKPADHPAITEAGLDTWSPAAALEQLLRRLQAGRQPEITKALESLSSRLECPDCRADFRVWDALVGAT